MLHHGFYCFQFRRQQPAFRLWRELVKTNAEGMALTRKFLQCQIKGFLHGAKHTPGLTFTVRRNPSRNGVESFVAFDEGKVTYRHHNGFKTCVVMSYASSILFPFTLVLAQDEVKIEALCLGRNRIRPSAHQVLRRGCQETLEAR